MPRISPSYNEAYARLDEAFPGQYLLSRTQVADFLGVSRNTVYNRFASQFPPRRLLTKAEVAKALSRG